MTNEIKAKAYDELMRLNHATAEAVVRGELTESQAGRVLSTFGAISCFHVKQGIALSASEIEKKACDMLMEDMVDGVCEKLLGGGA